jgi:hypothetical protein
VKDVVFTKADFSCGEDLSSTEFDAYFAEVYR